MSKDRLPTLPPRPTVHRAEASIAFGRRAGMSASVEITSGGILAIAALVSGILLSSAVIVRSARRPRSGALRRD
jgi:hypothetical protein